MGDVQNWGEGHSLTIWLIEPILLPGLVIRKHLSKESLPILQCQRQALQWRTRYQLQHPQIPLQRRTKLILQDLLMEVQSITLTKRLCCNLIDHIRLQIIHTKTYIYKIETRAKNKQVNKQIMLYKMSPYNTEN